MKPEFVMVVATEERLPTYVLTADAKRIKEEALVASGLIGKVENAAQNADAVEAQKSLKAVSQLFERQRKKLKEPIIEAGRQLDRVVQAELLEIEKELGRVAGLTSKFQLAEQRRVREEQERQRKELERIERERQEALAAAKTPEAKQAVEEQAAAKTAVAAAPIQTTREAGQVVRTDWEIHVINPWELAKFHPDCVKIEALLTPIKQRLNEGLEVKGVKAVKVTKTDVRVGSRASIIEV